MLSAKQITHRYTLFQKTYATSCDAEVVFSDVDASLGKCRNVGDGSIAGDNRYGRGADNDE